MSKAAESYAACAAFASAAYQSLKMLETLADIPEHRGKCSGKTAIALKKRDRDIYIYYQDTRKNVWDALKTGFEQAYSLSVSIKTDCLCLQLTPRSEKEDLQGIARCLAVMMAGGVQRVTMERMVRRMQPVETDEQASTLVMLCMARAAQKGLSQRDEPYVEAIEKRIHECLIAHNSIHIEGFLTFRMRDYLIQWAACVDEVLQYVSAKAEYDAYMDILQRFYAAQPCRCQLAIVHERSGGYLLQADGRDMHVGWRAALRSFTPEEELMHILLQLAPAHIELRMSRKGRAAGMVRSLQMVFGSVVEVKQND